jgi:hypothetical protein
MAIHAASVTATIYGEWKIMAHKLDTKEAVSWEEISYSNMMEQEALLRLLVKKGIVTKEEFLEEMRALKKELAGKKGE